MEPIIWKPSRTKMTLFDQSDWNLWAFKSFVLLMMRYSINLNKY